MRSLFALLLVLCAVVIAQESQTKPASPSHRVKHQEPSNGDKDHSGNHVPPSAGITNTTTFVLQESPKQNDERGKQPRYWDKVISPEILPIWIASLVAIVGTIVAVCTLLAIKREAIEIQDVAKAATKNADALMLSDRAWLLMERTLTQDQVKDPALLTVEEMASSQQSSHCIFTLKNYGKTPGKMIAWKYELQVGSNPGTIPDTSVYDMSNLPVLTHDIIPQGASVAQQAEFRILPTNQTIADIQNGIQFLWLCGFVKYVDTFERGNESQHETVFCYFWEVRMSTPKPFWRPFGTAEYNKAS